MFSEVPVMYHSCWYNIFIVAMAIYTVISACKAAQPRRSINDTCANTLQERETSRKLFNIIVIGISLLLCDDSRNSLF